MAFLVDGTGSMGPFIQPLRDRFADVVTAFQRRFLPQHLTGALDRPTLARIAVVHRALAAA